jgi:hypothetical protein
MRQIYSIGRWDETPPLLTIEYDGATGTYRVIGTAEDMGQELCTRVILEILPTSSDTAISSDKLLEFARIQYPEIGSSTFQSVLKNLVEDAKNPVFRRERTRDEAIAAAKAEGKPPNLRGRKLYLYWTTKRGEDQPMDPLFHIG